MSLGTEFIELKKSIHDRNSFDCGENDKYKICAFYTIAPSSIKRESLPAKLAKNCPITLFQYFYWLKWLSTSSIKGQAQEKSL